MLFSTSNRYIAFRIVDLIIQQILLLSISFFSYTKIHPHDMITVEFNVAFDKFA